jgi:hypothetical protein
VPATPGTFFVPSHDETETHSHNFSHSLVRTQLTGTLAPSARLNHAIASIGSCFFCISTIIFYVDHIIVGNVCITFGGLAGRYFVPRRDLWALNNDAWVSELFAVVSMTHVYSSDMLGYVG